jgi:glycosyltransferase involved in cell wall biosynthesis
MVQVIPNTLDMTIFKPTSKEEAKKSLGITPNQFVLISGSMPSRQDLYKGASYLLEAIPIFVKQFAINPEQIELLIFGNRDQKSVPDFGIKTTFLGTISDDMQLALCYSAADVFLIPSIEDNLPNTVMESLACGTPVVAFTTGGIPDMVLHQQNGYLAAYKSSNSFAAGINWIYQHPQREQLNIDARRTVEDLFSEALIAKKHKLFYQQVLDQHVSA